MVLTGGTGAFAGESRSHERIDQGPPFANLEMASRCRLASPAGASTGARGCPDASAGKNKCHLTSLGLFLLPRPLAFSWRRSEGTLAPSFKCS